VPLPNKSQTNQINTSALHFPLVNPKKKKQLEIIIMLSLIWFVITLPLPFIITNPDIAQGQLFIILQLTIMISIPFIILAVAWTLKPELTT